MPKDLGSPTTVLFDLDGTITDSAAAITTAVAAALQDFGHSPLPESVLLRFAGPPLHQGFAEFAGVPTEQLDALVRAFRRHYRAHMLAADLYPGVEPLLHGLAGAGVPLAVATSKVRTLAVRILQHHGLSDLFATVGGAHDDETGGDKGEVIHRVLHALGGAGVDVSNPVMVGDRRHDIEGAARHGVPTVLVDWGFGEPGEEAGAAATVRTAGELAAVLGVSRHPGAGRNWSARVDQGKSAKGIA